MPQSKAALSPNQSSWAGRGSTVRTWNASALMPASSSFIFFSFISAHSCSCSRHTANTQAGQQVSKDRQAGCLGGEEDPSHRRPGRTRKLCPWSTRAAPRRPRLTCARASMSFLGARRAATQQPAVSCLCAPVLGSAVQPSPGPRCARRRPAGTQRTAAAASSAQAQAHMPPCRLSQLFERPS